MTSIRVVQLLDQRTERRGPEVARHGDQGGDGLGHRDGVHGDVGEVDPWDGPLGRAA